MVRKPATPDATPRPAPAAGQPVSLRALADYLGLSPATLSLVINKSPAARAIPQETKDRILAAARRFNYRPNYVARSLRTQRSFTLGVVVSEVSDGYPSLVLSGIEDFLLNEGYFYFVVSHRRRPDLLEDYGKLLLARNVEGIIAVDTPCNDSMPVPVVAVSGHHDLDGVTSVVLDHERAAALALEHLASLGHRNIAFIKGHDFSADTAVRWNAITNSAAHLHLPVTPALTAQLELDSSSPELGYAAARRLLASRHPFTALFAFNDVSAIGAIRALREAGLRVPEDVSVVGFDDIQSAAYQNPSLTTVRQPLREMGKIAAAAVLHRIGNSEGKLTARIVVQPELVIRESTTRCPRSQNGKVSSAK
ncbi:MAG TPA: LacI family DNA-binding transcriptional regulator [Terriglobales bacterium]|nr:LacI family DNA-binding transcriptional regulator [Terriglobales bacterium]